MKVWLLEQKNQRTTLPQIIGAISDRLQGTLKDDFRTKLIDAGYHESQKHFYEETGYGVRSLKYYRVSGDFPRILRSELRSGVMTVKYEIELVVFERFEVGENEVTAMFRECMR